MIVIVDMLHTTAMELAVTMTKQIGVIIFVIVEQLI